MILAGALCCALSVVLGAFGAHALTARLTPHSLQLWETAARYLMYGGFGQVLVGLAALAPLRGVRAVRPVRSSQAELAMPAVGPAERAGRLLAAAGASLLAGTALFSGTVAALALGAPPWLGAVTPLGGLLLIAGFLLFAWAARRPGTSRQG